MLTLESPSHVAVLDGLGGHPAGDRAASLAAEVIGAGSSQVETEQQVTSLVDEANHFLYEAMGDREGLRTMGATIAGALVTTDRVVVFHLRDSWVHRPKDEQLTQVTVDDWEDGWLWGGGA